MSQPRRRRRKGRRRAGSGAPQPQGDGGAGSGAAGAPEPAAAPPPAGERGGRKRRRRRGRGGGPAVRSPKSSEEIFRTERVRPERVGAAADGRTLEAVIGELQSAWGVPQSPQEYRITLRVAEEREVRGERVATVEETIEDPTGNGHPRREKAPAAPRMTGVASGTGDEGAAPARRKRSRRRRRRKS